MALLAGGNAPLVVRDEVTAVPVRGISPTLLAVAARRDDARPLCWPAWPRRRRWQPTPPDPGSAGSPGQGLRGVVRTASPA
ncbi:hypothetical protein OG760_29475 [Streptomyces sp. NBC_00963]|uniref:hypothetical protein n=1 Tax=Streptomyces sp. NBC_00963 TaxID=2903697 RepID=UPI003868B5C4|nr:hypothetical protein OG760_29475 [Streptomyces sp. NBC_00963]